MNRRCGRGGGGSAPSMFGQCFSETRHASSTHNGVAGEVGERGQRGGRPPHVQGEHLAHDQPADRPEAQLHREGLALSIAACRWACWQRAKQLSWAAPLALFSPRPYQQTRCPTWQPRATAGPAMPLIQPVASKPILANPKLQQQSTDVYSSSHHHLKPGILLKVRPGTLSAQPCWSPSARCLAAGGVPGLA